MFRGFLLGLVLALLVAISTAVFQAEARPSANTGL
jgi:hypothetical protein